jgi:hypothetical protein
MDPVETLAALAGNWRGTSTLQDPHSGKPDGSPSELTVTPMLGGRFVRLDYPSSRTAGSRAGGFRKASTLQIYKEPPCL